MFVKCRLKKANTRGNEPISLVTVNPDDSRLLADSNNYTYKYVITLDSDDYIYMSNYPFYGYIDSDLTHICMANDTKRRKISTSSLQSPTTTSFNTINDVAYRAETTGRSAATIATIVSNYPIIDVNEVN